MDVELNGCDLDYTLGTATLLYTHGTIDIFCEAGKEITLKATAPGTKEVKCTIHIPGQTLSGAQYYNLGSGASRELTVLLATGKSVSYSQTKGTGIGACAEGSKTNGSWVGTGKVKAETDPGATQTGLWIE